jgi:hypothetical protein
VLYALHSNAVGVSQVLEGVITSHTSIYESCYT